MAVPVSEYEVGALPELEAEGELQNRRFFAVLSNLARRVPGRGSLLTGVAMAAARQGARRAFPALRRAGVGATDNRPTGWMDPSASCNCPTAGFSEAEISP